MDAGTISFFSALCLFSGKLIKKLFIPNPGKKPICSPLLIQSCLGVTRLGVDVGTTTATEPHKDIGITFNDESEIGKDFHEPLELSPWDSMLYIAYNMFIIQDYAIPWDFDDILTEELSLELENLDLAENTIALEKTSEWVEIKMNHLTEEKVVPIYSTTPQPWL